MHSMSTSLSQTSEKAPVDLVTLSLTPRYLRKYRVTCGFVGLTGALHADRFRVAPSSWSG